MERRRQVLDAALICFRRKGFAGTTMAEICREAGMSPGHLYHYFPGKEDIIGAIAEEDRALASKGFTWLASQEDLITAIASVIAGERQDVGSYAIDGGLALEIYAEAERSRRVRAAVHGNYAALHEALLAQIRIAQVKGGIDVTLDPAAVATLLLALFDGLVVAASSAEGFQPGVVSATISLLLERFLRGAQRSDDH